MESIQELLNRGAEQLVGRASGPMHIRLLLQPTMSMLLAFRAGMKDAREGKPAFLWTLLTQSERRGALVKSAWKDLSRLVALAIVLDVTYQGVVLHTFYPVQAVLVVCAVAVVPYALTRGLVTRLGRGLYRWQGRPPEPTPDELE